MADIEERIALGTLLDFYGPLLTEHRSEIVRQYCEEDMSLSEIADTMGITRQGVSDALNKARRQLEDYETRLGLAARYRLIRREAEEGIRHLDAGEIPAARERLMNILRIER